MLTGRHKTLSMVEGVQHGDVDGIAFVGYHTGAGTEGVLAHTYLANSITGVWVNEHPRQRGLAQRHRRRRVRRAGRPGHRRRLACEDAHGYAPEALKVAVKDHVSRYAAVCRTAGPHRRRHPRPPRKEAAALARAPRVRVRRAVHRRAGVRRRRIWRWPPPWCPAWTGSASGGSRTPRHHVRGDPHLQGGHDDRLGTRWRSSMADAAGRCDEVVEFTSDLIRIDTSNRGGGDCPSGRPPSTSPSGSPRPASSPLLLESAPQPRQRGRPDRGHRPGATRAARARASRRRTRRARRLDRAPLLRRGPRRLASGAAAPST